MLYPFDVKSTDADQSQRRERLVPVLAELQMLKQLEEDLVGRTKRIEQLFAARGADGVSEVEAALLDRLANRHNSVTQIFLQIKE